MSPRQRVDITDRNVVVASVQRARVVSPECQRIEITSTDAGTFATFVGLTDPTTGKEQRTGFADPNLRPQIVGVFTDLVGPAPPGLSVSATIDTRFSTKPTPLKLAAMLGAIAATVIALVALWRLDRLDGRRMRSVIPERWRTFTAADVVVVGTFLAWHTVGANSSDDGYILGMARVADHAGYMSNYFRWFGSPEDPFGWYYNLLALMTHVSDASIWMRLPDLVAALVCWLLLSREVLPRLGPAVESSKAAMWAAGLVLLAAWMPFNNGLRPEGQIAVGALITYVLIERAIISGRMTPAALAVVAAAFTLGIQPTGLIAVAALLAGGRPLLRILVRRHRIVGTWPLVAPLLAAGTVVLTVIFADQTIATVLEATRIRTDDRAQPGVVHREPALLLPHAADGGRLAVATIRLPDHGAEPVHLHVRHVAAQTGSRRRPRPGVATDGNHLRHDVLPDVHADEVGPSLRSVRRRWCGDGRPCHRAGVTQGVALVPQPDDGRDGGAVPAGAVLRHHQRVVVRLELRCSVQQRHAEDRRNHRQHNLLRAVRDRCDLHGLAALRHARPRRGPDRAGTDRSAHSGRSRLHGGGVRRLDARRCGAAVSDLLERVGQPARVHRRLRPGRRRACRARHQRRLHDAATGQLRPAGPAGRREACRVHPEWRSRSHCGRSQPDDAAPARHRLRLGRPDEADHQGRQRVDGSAALRPRPGAGSRRGHLCRRATAAEHADIGVVRAAAARRRPSACGRHRGRNDFGQQCGERTRRRPDPSSWSMRGQGPTARPRPRVALCPTTSRYSRRGATSGSPGPTFPATPSRFALWPRTVR